MAEYTPELVREYLDAWQDMKCGHWSEATLLRRRIQGGHSPARAEDGGRDLSIARTLADIIVSVRSLNTTQQLIIGSGVFHNKAPMVLARRDWSDVAQHYNLELWFVHRAYRDATCNMAYSLGWRRLPIVEIRITFASPLTNVLS